MIKKKIRRLRYLWHTWHVRCPWIGPRHACVAYRNEGTSRLSRKPIYLMNDFVFAGCRVPFVLIVFILVVKFFLLLAQYIMMTVKKSTILLYVHSWKPLQICGRLYSNWVYIISLYQCSYQVNIINYRGQLKTYIDRNRL